MGNWDKQKNKKQVKKNKEREKIPTIILLPSDEYGGECIVTGVNQMNLSIRNYKVIGYKKK